MNNGKRTGLTDKQPYWPRAAVCVGEDRLRDAQGVSRPPRPPHRCSVLGQEHPPHPADLSAPGEAGDILRVKVPPG